MKIIPVILAGGSGSRLWPLSRQDFPKQFLALTPQEQTLLQLTCRRLSDLKEAQPPIVVAGEAHRFIVERQLRAAGLKDWFILLEPRAKNTAPAIGLAAHFIKAQLNDENATMVVMPADHYIKQEARLRAAVLRAAKQAQAGGLGTFGIVPTHPHSGYGYIRARKQTRSFYQVDEFVEKPAVDRAQKYIDSGKYYWNSGIFTFTAAAYLRSLRQYSPAMERACRLAIQERYEDLNFVRVGDAFTKSPADSIDYAVMEKETDLFLIPLQLTWSDIGSWHALTELYQNDNHGNCALGDATICGGGDVFVHAKNQRLVATVGVHNVVVADTPDATLIVNRDRSEDVKTLVETLRKAKHPKADQQYRSHRPWGWYESLIKHEGFQVKRLAVYPNASLSLQSHRHRSEHWVVVQGEAEVTCDERVMTLTKNQSTYIPLGAKHRLRNSAKELLIIIEVQSGTYLGEDDIIRYDDVYGRSPKKDKETVNKK